MFFAAALAAFIMVGGLPLKLLPVHAQASFPDSIWNSADQDRVDEQIRLLVQEGLQQGADRRTEVLDELWGTHLREVRTYAGPAVRALERVFDSPEVDERRMAVLLLDRIGGSLAAASLARAARTDPDPDVRLEALLRLLRGNSFEGTCRLVGEVLERESRPESIKYAQQLLEGFPEPQADSGSRQPIDLLSTRPLDQIAHEEQERIDKRISTIIDEVLQSGTIMLDGGVIAMTRSHPTEEHIREVVAYGPAAIPGLEKFYWTDNGFAWRAARRLLTCIGGREMVPGLATVVREHPHSFQRYEALITVTEGTSFGMISKLLQDLRQTEPEGSKLADLAERSLSGCRPSQ